MYFVAIRSTISQAGSPSSHSTTLPRMMTGRNGLSAGVRESATRGSRRRLRALREPGPVRMATWSPCVAIQTGTEWGAPSGRTLARWAIEVPSSTRRTSKSSMVVISWACVLGWAASWGCRGSALDLVVQVGDTGRRYGLDEAEADVLRELSEEGSAAPEQDRHLMEDHLVDEPGRQRRGQDAAAHETDIPVTGSLASRRHRVLDAGGDEGLPLRHLRRRPVAE